VGFQIVQKILQSRHQISGRNLTTLIVLAQRADDSTGQCWPSRLNISRQARQSPRTTTRAIHALAETGILIVQERKSGCRSNLYTIDVTLAECDSCPSYPRNVQKPARNLWKSCGRAVEKPVECESTGANVGTLNNQLEKVLGKREVETGATVTGCEFRSPLFPVPDLAPLLNHLSMDAHTRPRCRGSDPGPVSRHINPFHTHLPS
jgi:hypothetical protein